MRVVSLVPSSTETLLALGANVVACTRFCEQPDLVHVGGTKNPDVEAIVDLAADLVVMDREENRLEDFETLREAGVPLYVSDVKTVTDAQTVVTDLADRVGVDSYSTSEPHAMAPSPIHAASAFVPIWRRPWMSIGVATYGASVLEHLGWSVLDFGDDSYPTIELVDVAAMRPQLIVVPSEPYEFTPAHLDELRTAIPGSRIAEVDGRDLFWWGTRTPSAMTRLSVILSDLA